MKKVKIKVHDTPQNAMCRDLADKFIVDQSYLLKRHLSIMVPTLGRQSALDIISTVLAMSGVTLVETVAKAEPGTFLALVKHAMKNKPK